MSKNTRKKNNKSTSKFVILLNKFSSNKNVIFTLVFGLIGGWFLHNTFAATVFNDDFNSYPDGLITSEYSYWNPNSPSAKKNDKWEMTSGALFSATLNGAKVAYSGYPTFETSIGPGPSTTSGNNSAVFRLTSVPKDFGNAEVSFKLYNKQLVSTSGTPAVAWDGIHVFLRYQSDESLYYASVNRRDGALAIKKKVPGGSSNGGTYYTLASKGTGSYPIQFNTWQNIKTSIRTNTDGTVTIQIFSNDRLLLSYIDNGSVGGAPIINPGKVGIRGDNAEFYFDDFAVNNPDIVDSPNPPSTPPSDTVAPTTSIAMPANNATITGSTNITATASDDTGVAKVEFYDGLTLIGATTTSPYSLTWDTMKVSNGTHTLTTKAYDANQNVGTSSAISVNVSNQTTTAGDTIAPVIDITSPLNSEYVGKRMRIAADATDNIQVVNMYVYIDGSLIVSTSGSSVNTVKGIKSGRHTITVTAVDAAGNIGRSSVVVYR